ncbi:MAG: redoxin family protein [Gemmatimonadaceae bacterium]|jgi:thiol-disulfide isomerase/thioredoxin|nr:redoxin family protein [Gemmatimonadaceae bacterium]
MTRRPTLRSLVGLAALSLAGLTPLSRAAAQDGGIAVGAMAPTVSTLEQLDGKTFDLSAVVGKRPVVMEFWATWCPLCRKLEPALQRAREQYGDRVMFVGIGVPDNQSPEHQRAYVDERKMSGTFVFDRKRAAMKAYQVPHTSYVVVLDGSGKVVYTGVGGDQDIDAAVRRALPAK